MAKNKENRKLRLKWNVLIPLALAVILTVYLIIALIVGLITNKGGKKPVNHDIYNICSFNGNQTYQAIVNEDRENPVALEDYNFYGESLNLYFNQYDLEIGRASCRERV